MTFKEFLSTSDSELNNAKNLIGSEMQSQLSRNPNQPLKDIIKKALVKSVKNRVLSPDKAAKLDPDKDNNDKKFQNNMINKTQNII